MVTTVTEPLSSAVQVVEKSPSYGKFVLEPLVQGYGITVGNAMRRVLLSSLPGYAVTAVHIESVQHEYSTLPHMKEDITEFLLNVKQIRLMPVVVTDQPILMRLDWQGEGVVKAGDIQPAGEGRVINPDVVLATMDSADARLSVEFRVERGIGFVRADAWEDRDSIGVLPVDALFSPVRKVNYTVEHTRVGQVTDFDRVVLEVWTDETMDPEETVRQSAQILIDHFSLFANLGRQPVPRQVERRSLVAPVSDELYNTPVEDLKLSSRTLNCLRRGNIRTVGEVLERSREELLALRNFGERSLQELYTKLRDIGVPIETDEEKAAKTATAQEAEAQATMGAYSAGAEEEEEEGPPTTTGRTFYPD